MTHLVVEDVSLIRQGKRLLDHVTLRGDRIGSIAVIGPNGAGKSSLLKMIAGIVAPTSGRVLFDGSTMTAALRSATIGFVPQTFSPHWDLRVEELIHLGQRRIGHRRPVEADPVHASWLDLIRRQRWSQLSGGERIRVLLAMVLATDPPILLADEPFASLDIRQKLDTAERLVSRGRCGLSIVVVHDIDLALRYFDRIIVMDRGRIVADGAKAQILTSGVLQQTFGVTFVETSVGHYCAITS